MRRALAAAAVVAAVVVPAAPARPAPPPRSFTIAAAGDVLIHERVARIASLGGGEYDFSPMFSSIEPWISGADLAICHLESTLSPTNTGLSHFPRFIVPHEIADAVAGAGYDTCSTAGNHALDGGWDGLVATLDLLDEAGVRHDGTARTPEERLPGLYDAGGVTVAHLSYTYGTNGLRLPEDHPYAVNITDPEVILADAAWARAHGAEFVIVSMHWGSEAVVPPTGSQRVLAETLLASDDVDLILGAHAHVVQPIDRIGDKYVVYGMGNHLSNMNSAWHEDFYAHEDGLLVLVRVSDRSGRLAVDGIDIVPTWVRNADYRILPVRSAIAAGDEAPTRTLEASLARTVGRVRLLGVSGVRLAPVVPPAEPCWCRVTVLDEPMARRIGPVLD